MSELAERSGSPIGGPERCVRSGCDGTYATDGYCDECGRKAPVGAGAAARTATSGSVPTTTGGSQAGPSKATGTTTGTHRRGRTGGRGRLGASLVAIPPMPLLDPASAVMTDPKVPESHRYCGKCREPVGRGHDGQPGRTEGFCPRDRTPYSFAPRMSPGDLVDHRYEILGALAHGGLGWIYLARDRNISESGADRWVVLKGLINTGDPDAMQAAMAERRFLVEIDHPNIVKIHDLAEHPDPKTGEMVGYIVMEYVGGRSLKDLALSNLGSDGWRAPLPLPHVLAYGLEVLPAIGYMHDRGLLFCDFKPDNVIHAEERLKLIDLGAVRRIGDSVSPLWGTPGYQAPELATAGASIGSDIYTVGRTLAVLSFDFRGFSTRFADRLPDAGEVELLRSEESYHRLLRRATHRDPARRFLSAADMADQLVGVLREVLSAADGVPHPATSTQFTAEHRTFGTGMAEENLSGSAVAIALPLPLVDPTDPAAGFLATLSTTDPESTVDALQRAPVRTVEVTLQLVRAMIEAGDIAGATAELGIMPDDGGDWRHDWSAGLIALAAGQPDQAVPAFDTVYDALPGEPAAQLALAAAGELAGERHHAARRYERVWRVDHGFVSAAFGLARMRLADGDRHGAVAVLDEVSDSSSHHVAAQIAAVRARLARDCGPLTAADFVESSTRLERLRLDTQRRANLAVEMFNAALAWLEPAEAANVGAAPTNRPVAVPAQPALAATGRLLGQVLTEREVRFGLERAYRVLAAQESDPLARYALVDQANAVRPRTVV
jgi:serine/threonine-protein kinase PknG